MLIKLIVSSMNALFMEDVSYCASVCVIWVSISRKYYFRDAFTYKSPHTQCYTDAIDFCYAPHSPILRILRIRSSRPSMQQTLFSESFCFSITLPSVEMILLFLQLCSGSDAVLELELWAQLPCIETFLHRDISASRHPCIETTLHRDNPASKHPCVSTSLHSNTFLIATRLSVILIETRLGITFIERFSITFVATKLSITFVATRLKHMQCLALKSRWVSASLSLQWVKFKSNIPTLMVRSIWVTVTFAALSFFSHLCCNKFRD